MEEREVENRWIENEEIMAYLLVYECHEVNAKSLSAILVRQIGHSVQAREHDLHTAEKFTARLHIMFHAIDKLKCIMYI